MWRGLKPSNKSANRYPADHDFIPRLLRAEIIINKFNLTILIMIATIKVSSRGQMVIPEDIRKHMNIREGTKLVMIEKNNKIILELERDFLSEIEKREGEKEKLGWLKLAEESMAKVWDNPQDDEIWSTYL